MRLIRLSDAAFTNLYCIDRVTNELVFVSVVSNKEAAIKSVTASMNLGDLGKIYDSEDLDNLSTKNLIDEFSSRKGNYLVPIERIQIGKQNYYVAMAIAEGLVKGGRHFLAWEDVYTTLYNKLMQTFTIPILKDWSKYLYSRLESEGLLMELDYWVDRNSPIKSEKFNLENMRVFRLDVTESKLKDIISEGLEVGDIKISENEQKSLEFENLDGYFAKYGHTAVENLLRRLKPLIGLINKVKCIFKKKKPFPRQAQLINGVVELFKVSKYAFINAGMGCGKSFMSCAAVEKYEQDKLKKSNPNMSLSELSKNTKYRAIYMVPGHLVKKTKREIEDEIPLAKVEIITDFKQIIALKKKPTKPQGKEFYIISKDFSKLEYQKRPAVYKWGRKRVRYIRCSECEDTETTLHEYFTKGNTCSKCKQDSLEVIDARYFEEGWICPECGELIYPSNKKSLTLDPVEDNKSLPLGPFDFSNQKISNSTCRNCKAELWTANIRNLNQGKTFSDWVKNKENPWLRVSFWRNKSKKGKKTVWIYKDFLKSFLIENEICEGEYSITNQQLSRKVAPATYIKKQLGKDFFDFAVFDEAHQYKGGATAQGSAFHSLIKASKKQLLLTGTIMGGVAKDIFYILYRLDPKRMLDTGYKYEDVLKFSEDYGVIETDVMYDSEDEYYNTSSKGKKISEPKVKPGISPLLYSHFLLDKAVFMDLSELSAFLPKFIERTIRVDMSERLHNVYSSISETFRKLLREKGGKKLIASMLQTLLSYLDKPYGFSTILHPDTGHELIDIPDLDNDILYPKEEALLELINQEYNEEGRMCVVYTIFTGEGEKDVTLRLKRIIEDNCNLKDKVAILKSNTVKAADREEWLKRRIEEGYKVVICNPKLVETGMDLLYHPTLIFYQTGYSLFTLWQSSRRAYRLNQKKECRVYYLAYKMTLQDECLKLMAEKKVATAAIQGQFSAEGLAAMALGTDPQVALAQSLSFGSTNIDDKLEEMFTKINEVNQAVELSEEDKEFLRELEAIKEEILDMPSETKKKAVITSIFDLFNKKKISKSTDKNTDSNISSNTKDDFVFKVFTKEEIKELKKKKKVVEGQQSFL